MMSINADGMERATGVADWRDRICSTFVDLDCDDVDRDSFFGSVSSRQCDDIRFSRVVSTRQRVVRSQARLSRSTADDFLLSLQTQGHGIVRQGGREAVLRPGDMVLYDTSRWYELAFEGNFRQLILTVPRTHLLRAMPVAENLTAIAIPGANATSQLVASHISNLARQCMDIAPSAQRIANATVLDLLAAAVPMPDLGSSAGRVGDTLFDKARDVIDRHLDDPELSPSNIASSLGVSVRYLNLVFAKHGAAVSRSIWDRRVQRAARDLQNPMLSAQSITTIAFALGFNDAAHFSRAFKAVFGETPSQYRSKARRSN